jgi:hypothetical protein
MKKFESLDKITIRQGKEKFTFSLQEELKIDENTINEDLEAVPRIYGYLSVLRAKVTRNLSDKQLEYRRLYADLYGIAKGEDVNGKAPTEEHTKQMIMENVELQDTKEQIIGLEHDVAILEGVLEALRFKVSLMQTLSANHRVTI